MAAIARALAPIPVLAPEPDLADSLTELQWEVFEALIEAVVPSIVVGAASSSQGPTADETQRHLFITEEDCADAYDDIIRTLKVPPTYAQFKEYLAARPLENPRFYKQLRRLVAGTPKSVRKRLGGALSLMT